MNSQLEMVQGLLSDYVNQMSKENPTAARITANVVSSQMSQLSQYLQELEALRTAQKEQPDQKLSKES